MICPCGKEITRQPYDTDRQWQKRLVSGYCRSKCSRLYPKVKQDCPKPSLPPVSANYSRPEMVAQEKEIPERDLARLAYARSMPCCLCGEIEGIHAHHEAEEGKGTMGGKPSDRRTIPLCWRCHKKRHDKGREVFKRLDVEGIIQQINSAYDKIKEGAKSDRI